MIGRKFNDWTIIDGPLAKKKGYDKYLCRCSCGLEKPVAIDRLRNNESKRCRDCSAIRKRITFSIDEMIGDWRVISEPIKRKGAIYQLCRCCCGKENYVRTTVLNTGRSLHCHRCPMAKDSE